MQTILEACEYEAQLHWRCLKLQQELIRRIVDSVHAWIFLLDECDDITMQLEPVEAFLFQTNDWNGITILKTIRHLHELSANPYLARPHFNL